MCKMTPHLSLVESLDELIEAARAGSSESHHSLCEQANKAMTHTDTQQQGQMRPGPCSGRCSERGSDTEREARQRARAQKRQRQRGREVSSSRRPIRMDRSLHPLATPSALHLPPVRHPACSAIRMVARGVFGLPLPYLARSLALARVSLCVRVVPLVHEVSSQLLADFCSDMSWRSGGQRHRHHHRHSSSRVSVAQSQLSVASRAPLFPGRCVAAASLPCCGPSMRWPAPAARYREAWTYWRREEGALKKRYGDVNTAHREATNRSDQLGQSDSRTRRHTCIGGFTNLERKRRNTVHF